MTPSLPAALRDSAQRLIETVRPAELARRSEKLSAAYRGEAACDSTLGDDPDVAAYLAARLPATYAAMSAALSQVLLRLPEFAPKSLLDAGAGPGTASWAALEAWPELQSITMIDRNAKLLATARTLAAASNASALRDSRIVAGDLKAPDGTYDLVLAGYAIAELPHLMLDEAVARLWTGCSGVFVLVEPGTPAGFARTLRIRTRLIGLGARLIAPCPGAYPCPIVAPDWCHFSVRLPRLRAHLKAKGASVPFEDEKFSYLAVARDGVAISSAPARILGTPHVSKPGIRLKLCADGRIEERTVLKRDRTAYKAIAKSKWGDAPDSLDKAG